MPPSDSTLPLSESEPSLGGKGARPGGGEAPIRRIDASIHDVDASTRRIDPSIHDVDASTPRIDPSIHGVNAPMRRIDPSIRDVNAPTRRIDGSIHDLPAPTRRVEASIHDLDTSGSRVDAPIRDVDASLADIDAPGHASDPPLAGVVPLERVTRAAVRAYLGRPEARTLVMSIVAARVKPENVENLVQDALVEALGAPERNLPAREEALPAWLATIARRTIADFVVKQKRRAAYEAPMPGHWGTDEGHDDGDDEGPRRSHPDLEPEPSHDPRAALGGDPEVNAWLVREWLERQVARHPRDRETLALLVEHAGGKTYEQIAQELGVPLAALSSRILRFKSKYMPRYRRWRSRAILLLLLGAAAIVAAIVLWILSSRPADIGPDPYRAPPSPAPAPSVTASAPDPFERALPTQPPTQPPTQLPDKPPTQPRRPAPRLPERPPK